MISLYHRIFDKVQYKFSLIFTGIYVVIYMGNSWNTTVFFLLFLAILTAIGIAGIGYLLNDWNDREQDKIAGKSNIFLSANKLLIVVIPIAFCVLAILPWLYLPNTRITFYLLSIEIILFIVYAFPPLRLKERPVAGIICDAIYAQVLPCFIAAYTFSLTGTNIKLKLNFILVYFVWLFLAGLRNILLHQIDDYENDIKSNTHTFIIVHTPTFIYKSAFKLLLFFELLTFCYTLSSISIVSVFVFIFYIFIIVILNNNLNEIKYINFIAKRLFNEFYEIHLPIIILIIFTTVKFNYIYLLLFHILLFSPVYYDYAKKFIQKYF